MSQLSVRFLALIVLLVGFVAGVLAAIGCGTSGNAAFASNGTRTVIHTKTLATPVQWMDDFTFSTTFTPSDPNTVVHAVEVIGELQTGATEVVIRLQPRRNAVAGGMGLPITASANATAPLSIIAPYEFSVGILPGATYTFDVFMGAVTNGVACTINSLTLRIITSEGVTVVDPSPNLS